MDRSTIFSLSMGWPRTNSFAGPIFEDVKLGDKSIIDFPSLLDPYYKPGYSVPYRNLYIYLFIDPKPGWQNFVTGIRRDLAMVRPRLRGMPMSHFYVEHTKCLYGPYDVSSDLIQVGYVYPDYSLGTSIEEDNASNEPSDEFDYYPEGDLKVNEFRDSQSYTINKAPVQGFPVKIRLNDEGNINEITFVPRLVLKYKSHIANAQPCDGWEITWLKATANASITLVLTG